MAQLTLTRRSFMKAMAVTGAAASLTAVAEPMQALAEGVDADAGKSNAFARAAAPAARWSAAFG